MLIELHAKWNNLKRVLVNTNNVLLFEEGENDTFIHFSNGNRGYAVEESYITIKNMIDNKTDEYECSK